MATLLQFTSRANTEARFRCRSCALLFEPTAKQLEFCPQCASYDTLSRALDQFNRTTRGDAA